MRPTRTSRPGGSRLLALALLASCGSGGDPGAEGAEGIGRSGAPPPAPGASRLVAAHPEHDFGPVWEGAQLEHDFELAVEGSAPVTLEKVQADCGCTGSELLVLGGGEPEPYVEGTPLPAGTELLLRVRYNTRGKGGDNPRQVHVFGDQEGGATSVVIRALISPWITIEPERLALGPMRVEETDRVEFVARGTTGELFHLRPTGVGLPPGLTASAAPIDPDEEGRSRSWRVAVDGGPGLFEGLRGYPIHLESDVPNPEAPPDSEARTFRATAYVTVEVVGELSLRPEVLTFGGVGAKELVSRSVRLTCHDPAFVLAEPSARLVAVDSDEAPALAATASFHARPVPDANAWDVELVLDGLTQDVPPRFLARVVVETGHPEVPRLEAKVSGYRTDLRAAPALPPPVRVPDPPAAGGSDPEQGRGR